MQNPGAESVQRSLEPKLPRIGCMVVGDRVARVSKLINCYVKNSLNSIKLDSDKSFDNYLVRITVDNAAYELLLTGSSEGDNEKWRSTIYPNVGVVIVCFSVPVTVIAVVNAIIGMSSKKEFAAKDRKIALFGLIGTHVQLLIGLI